MGNKRRNHLKLRQTATSHGDINKNEMLTFKELDDNFIFLKERDLKTLKLDGNNLVYETLGGDNFTVDMSSLGGSSLWNENGTKIYYNTNNVGIGTSDPLSPLHLEGSDFDNSSIRFFNRANDNNENYWLIGSRSFGGSILDGFEIGRVGDSTGGKLYLTHDGNVGIGTYQPSQKLDVSGNVKISGTLNIGTLGAGTAVNNLGIDNSGNVVAGSSNYPTVGTYLSNRVTRWDTTNNRLTTSIIRDNGTTLGVNQDPASWVKFYIKSTSSDEGVGIYSVKTGSVLNNNVSAVRGYTTVSTLNSNQKIVAGIYGNSTLATSPTNGNYVGGYFRHGDHIDDVTGTGKDASGVFVSVDTKFSMQNIYGIKVDRMHITRSISGSVYGLRINAFSGSGTVSGGKYGIYQDGTVETNRFNGATTIDNDLTITNGNLNVSGTLNIGTLGAGTAVNNLGIDNSGNVVVGSTGGDSITNLSVGVHNGTSLEVVSSDGTNVVLPSVTTSLSGLMSNTDKTKLDSISTGAEVNQNTFSTIVVAGQSNIVADNKTDTLTLVEGSNITITTNSSSDEITISSTSSGGSSVWESGVGTESVQTINTTEPNTATGDYSLAGGNNCTSGDYSLSFGNDSSATGNYSIAVGNNNTSSGTYSVALGWNNVASGSSSTAFGRFTNSYGIGSFSAGWSTTAHAYGSTAIGRSTNAEGKYSFAGGITTRAIGDYSHSSGKGVSVGTNEIQSGGIASFCHFFMDSTTGHKGAYADYSAILGGVSHIINSGADGSVIIGGMDNVINASVSNSAIIAGDDIVATVNNMVYVPNLTIADMIPGSTTDLAINTAGKVTLSTSDERLKTNFNPIKTPLEKVLALSGLTYEWKEGEKGTQIGFIAQQVKEVVPELTGSYIVDEEEYYNVKYKEMTALLTEAIKEQQSIINELKNEVEALKNK